MFWKRFNTKKPNSNQRALKLMVLREKFMKVPHDASDEILGIHGSRYYKIYISRTSLFKGSF